MIRTRDELLVALCEVAHEWRGDWNAYRLGEQPRPEPLEHRLAAVLDETDNLKLEDAK